MIFADRLRKWNNTNLFSWDNVFGQPIHIIIAEMAMKEIEAKIWKATLTGDREVIMTTKELYGYLDNLPYTLNKKVKKFLISEVRHHFTDCGFTFKTISVGDTTTIHIRW